MQKFLKTLISRRTIVQAVIGVSLYLLFSRYNISLWWLLVPGVLTGLLFGKVFCRWMCPLGFVMELIMGMDSSQKLKQMYQYHKIGCPIAWMQGVMNRMSVLNIKLNFETCKTCGLCDKQCYIATLEPEKYSLYKAGKKRPGDAYACSKCLSCVAVCPNGSLRYKGGR
ncbi:4Fe-4S binding protein [Williamwhitmania taraxaci]|uniref:4Fe-4S dicluster domain-containing protein n=1 Tax=Williamwhitmania taraxaci TaxID=1640674 RepID=A0A1G6GU78_9BACT|nr:4Fe-4S binding protein [Williamwhitmania taraxaci]SDB85524.1 4Fe-4S dicluster domain-containing protein [Williamwhitmania taraxaci]